MTTTTDRPAVSATGRTFGERLLEAVTEADGPTQQERLSQWFWDHHRIEVSGAMINRYKNQDAAPRIEQCRQFAMALNVCVEWLYTERGPKRPLPPYDEKDADVIRGLHEIDDIGERTDWYGYLKIALPRSRPPRDRCAGS